MYVYKCIYSPYICIYSATLATWQPREFTWSCPLWWFTALLLNLSHHTFTNTSKSKPTHTHTYLHLHSNFLHFKSFLRLFFQLIFFTWQFSSLTPFHLHTDIHMYLCMYVCVSSFLVQLCVSAGDRQSVENFRQFDCVKIWVKCLCQKRFKAIEREFLKFSDNFIKKFMVFLIINPKKKKIIII